MRVAQEENVGGEREGEEACEAAGADVPVERSAGDGVEARLRVGAGDDEGYDEASAVLLLARETLALPEALAAAEPACVTLGEGDP